MSDPMFRGPVPVGADLVQLARVLLRYDPGDPRYAEGRI